MAGAKRKSPNALAGHRAKGGLLQLVPPAIEPPEPVRGWLKPTKEEWEEFWASPVAGQVNIEADLLALTDLFAAQDELRRALRLWRKEPIVRGSKGQPVLNPIRTRIPELRDYLLKIRREFGMTPLSRIRLGWSLAEGMGAMERMRRILDGSGDDE